MISVENLSKNYRIPILQGVTCQFPTGAVSFIMGANGTGKTTLFKCILGLESYSGQILFDGRQLTEVRDQVVPVFEDTPFYPHLNGRRNLEQLLGRRVGLAEAAEAMAFGGVNPTGLLREPVRGYSSGQRKRLAIAYAVLAKARYLLLDEVASGLDLPSMDAVVSTIRQIAPTSTVIVSGHQFDFYSRVVDHVVALRNGTLETVQVNGRSANILESTYRTLLGPGPQ